MQINNNVEENLNPRLQNFLVITIIISCFVFALKYIAYKQSNSVAIYSDAMESIINIIVSIIALIAVRISLKPADKTHPFGHNKAEYFSSAIEGILIIITAFVILHKIYIDVESKNHSFSFDVGIIYNVFAGIIQGIWGGIIYYAAKKYNSIALKADALHLIADCSTSVGIAVGLMLAYYTHYYILDYIIASFLALNIGWQGYNMLSKSVGGLMDSSVDKETYNKIKTIIAQNGLGALEAHDLKTRVAGYITFIEFHLVVESDMSVKEAHNICDIIENALKKAFKNVRVTIHIEPQEEAKHKPMLPIV